MPLLGGRLGLAGLDGLEYPNDVDHSEVTNQERVDDWVGISLQGDSRLRGVHLILQRRAVLLDVLLDGLSKCLTYQALGRRGTDRGLTRLNGVGTLGRLIVEGACLLACGGQRHGWNAAPAHLALLARHCQPQHPAPCA